MKMRPMRLTAAVTLIGPMARLVVPARKSSVPQHRAASEPSRTGFTLSDAVGADQVLAGGFEMPADEIGGGRGIAHLQRLENGAMLLVVDVDLLLHQDDLLHLLPLCMISDRVDMLIETVEQGIARAARQRQMKFRIELGEEILVAVHRFDPHQDAADRIEIAGRSVQCREPGHGGLYGDAGLDELQG